MTERMATMIEIQNNNYSKARLTSINPRLPNRINSLILFLSLLHTPHPSLTKLRLNPVSRNSHSDALYIKNYHYTIDYFPGYVFKLHCLILD